MAVVFLISSMAETSRTPFDLTEAESELVAGYQTEYSSMSFALYWLGEYANVMLMCALNATLFWAAGCRRSTWALPLPGITIGPGCHLAGAQDPGACSSSCSAWVKATVPRYRYDQLMRLGWKIFLPLSLAVRLPRLGWLMLTPLPPDRSLSCPMSIALLHQVASPFGSSSRRTR